VEIFDRIDDVADVIEGAKAMPLSQSCVVPRGEVLDLLEDVRTAIPDSVREADVLLRRRDDILADAERESEVMLASAKTEVALLRSEGADAVDRLRQDATREADRIIAEARARAERMVAAHEITAEARRQGAEAVDHARREADRVRMQADGYAANRLADLADSLAGALDEVRRGQSQLQRRLDRPQVVHHQAPIGGGEDIFDLESVGGFDEGRHPRRR
jgi:cell division septum initiation protein DivIVA